MDSDYLDEPVSYLTLPVGTPVVTSDGAAVGTVHRVLYHERERILDGIVVKSPDGLRFVDAPEVASMTRRQVDVTHSGPDFLALGFVRRGLRGGWHPAR